MKMVIIPTVTVARPSGSICMVLYCCLSVTFCVLSVAINRHVVSHLLTSLRNFGI